MKEVPNMSKYLTQYAELIRSTDFGNDVLPKGLLMARNGDFEVYYAPFEAVNPNARIVIVGITPGMKQALAALNSAQAELRQGCLDSDAILQRALGTAGFSGMRDALSDLLDHVGVHELLDLASTRHLFAGATDQVQLTSALMFPTFHRGKNYSGTPGILSQPFLKQQLTEHFGQSASEMPKALFVPLGKASTEALEFLAAEGILDRKRVLSGLPHPSGANRERVNYFLGRKPRLQLSAKVNADLLDARREALTLNVQALQSIFA
jgi:hypothetical protein